MVTYQEYHWCPFHMGLWSWIQWLHKPYQPAFKINFMLKRNPCTKFKKSKELYRAYNQGDCIQFSRNISDFCLLSQCNFNSAPFHPHKYPTEWKTTVSSPTSSIPVFIPPTTLNSFRIFLYGFKFLKQTKNDYTTCIS